jgi:hypothetical protein
VKWEDKHCTMAMKQFDPEKLRPAAHVCEPDPRSTMYVRVDLTTGTTRPMELTDHHESISACALHGGVPPEIGLQFETVKNVYLYAWFVYRFYPVAEQQSLACLELALRTRLEKEIRAGKIKGKQPTLRPLLEYAIKHRLLKNEGFSTWQNRGVINSRRRIEMEKLRQLSEKNLDQITWNESDIQILPEDLDWDYIKMLSTVLPKLRNNYAHGSTDLHNQALQTIKIVFEAINQLFEAPRI